MMAEKLPVLLSKYSESDPIKARPWEFTFTAPNVVRDGALIESYARSDMGWTFVGWAYVAIELLPRQDIVRGQVDALRRQKADVLAKAGAKANRLEGEIQKLLAIEGPNV